MPCLDFARTPYLNPASFPSTVPAGRLSWVPFAVDAVTYVTRDDSQLPDNLTIAELQAIYSCQFSTNEIRPVLPQPESPAQNSWLMVFVDSDSGAGNSALICQQTAVIQRQGFGAAANCGSIAGRSGP